MLMLKKGWKDGVSIWWDKLLINMKNYKQNSASGIFIMSVLKLLLILELKVFLLVIQEKNKELPRGVQCAIPLLFEASH